MIGKLLSRWPVIKQLQSGGDGTGREAWSERTHKLQPKTQDCQVTHSICPYCGVGCGQLIYHREGQMVAIEGDPTSPVSRGHLCPKGADTLQLHTHPGRLTKVKYRAPFSRDWQEIELEKAMDMVADRLWQAREDSFEEEREGQTLMQTIKAAHLGGATLDNEENYLIKKLFTGGLGMVCISNQARI